MSNVQIKQTIELTIDLNTYYQHFPPALRRAIDAAVIDLASKGARAGDIDPATLPPRRRQTFSPETLFWQTDKQPRKSSGPVACFVSGLTRLSRGRHEPIMRDDVLTMVREELGRMGRPASETDVKLHFRNLLGDGYLSLKEPV